MYLCVFYDSYNKQWFLLYAAFTSDLLVESYGVLCKVQSASLYIMCCRLLLVFRGYYDSKQTLLFVMFESDEKTNSYRPINFDSCSPPYANRFWNKVIKFQEYLCQCVNQHELLTLYAKHDVTFEQNDHCFCSNCCNFHYKREGRECRHTFVQASLCFTIEYSTWHVIVSD